MPRSWSLATHVNEVDQSGRVFCSYSKSISKIRQTRLFSHFLKMFKLRLMFPGSMPCRFLSWSPITDPLCSWIIWHEYLTKPASYASHRSHQPVADSQGVAAENFPQNGKVRKWVKLWMHGWALFSTAPVKNIYDKLITVRCPSATVSEYFQTFSQLRYPEKLVQSTIHHFIDVKTSDASRAQATEK